jgi:hypothetical protein
MTEDVEVMYPKWGVARGKAEVGQLYQDLALYVQSMNHDPARYTCMSDGQRVCIEGESSGQLVGGKSWQPDGECGGRLCTMFEIRGDLISRIYIYIDPDYCNQTANFYPWNRQG